MPTPNKEEWRKLEQLTGFQGITLSNLNQMSILLARKKATNLSFRLVIYMNGFCDRLGAQFLDRSDGGRVSGKMLSYNNLEQTTERFAHAAAAAATPRVVSAGRCRCAAA